MSVDLEVLNQTYLGNSILDYLISISIFFIGIVMLLIIERALFKRIAGWVANTSTQIDDVILAVLRKNIVPICYVISGYVALSRLSIEDGFVRMLKYAVIIFLSYQAARVAITVAVYLVERSTSRRSPSGGATRSIVLFLRFAIWCVAVLFVLDNLGFDVNAVVAGLGIGGVAVAFAAQAILGDLFNYFVIFFDRPFEEGDFIIIGDLMGVVQKIGIKTTRVMSLGGEQLVFSNTDLTSSRIRNYKRMQRRRVLFKFGVLYQTSHAKLKRIPEIVRGIIMKVKDAKFDRAHFSKFGDFSLDFEVVHYVLTGDYNKYMDIQQEINLAITEEFEKEGIEFAYPTQTIHLAK